MSSPAIALTGHRAWPRVRLDAGAWQIVWLAVPALAAVLVRVLSGPHTVDDAYITFRYARNLADGLGLVYNPGEWVLGTTTPAWAALLALSDRLGFTDLPAVATVLSAVSDAASAVLLARFALRLGWAPVAAAAVGLAWALNPPSIAFATGGMETSLFILVLLAAFSLALSGRVVLAAFVAGASITVRPEAALAAAAILGWATWRNWNSELQPGSRPSRAGACPPPPDVHVATRGATDEAAASGRGQAPTLRLSKERPRASFHWLRPLPWLAGVAAAVPALAWLGAQALIYGSLLPHSMAAKQVAYQHASAATNVGAFIVEALLPGWSTFLLGVLPTSLALVLLVGGLVLLAVLTWSAVRLSRRNGGTDWVLVAAFGVLFVAFYAVAGLRGARVWPWYLVPMVPLFLLLAAAGLRGLGRGWAWLAVALVIWQLPALDWQQRLQPVGSTLVRETSYLAAADYLEQQLPAGALVAAPEIGALGYAAPDLRLLDTVGLVSPAASAYYPLPASELVSDNAVPPRLIQVSQPDAVVALDEFERQSLLPDPWFQQHYTLAQSYPTQIWSSQSVLVYLKNPPGPSQ